jgi:hypothetical protein
MRVGVGLRHLQGSLECVDDRIKIFAKNSHFSVSAEDSSPVYIKIFKLLKWLIIHFNHLNISRYVNVETSTGCKTCDLRNNKCLYNFDVFEKKFENSLKMAWTNAETRLS